jgi:hypothetical protein
MAKLVDSAERYFRRSLGKKAKVLLINPPVQERRYHWLRWNQPVELLKLSAWLKDVLPAVDVRLFDFMRPDEAGSVGKHKVKETWATETGEQLWHFGAPFEDFERWLDRALRSERWVPDCIVVSSLTSYWHGAIEKLLSKLCQTLRRDRQQLEMVLYGNYPRIEPEHASSQPDADVALRTSVDTSGYCPDWTLYKPGIPRFFALDVEDARVGEHLKECLKAQTAFHKRTQNTRRPVINVAFFNDDVCSAKSRLDLVAAFRKRNPKVLAVDGIAGIRPETLTQERLAQMKAAGFRTLFVEHARTSGGGLDEAAYEPVRRVLKDELHAKKTGAGTVAWLEGAVTGFVAIGLPDDNLEYIVQTTLRLNRLFHSIIMKPFGYSPTIDKATVEVRTGRWRKPAHGTPQAFPYVGNGSALSRSDYDNLLAWQNVLNKRVKGTTFDFLDSGNIARLVRETIVGESWRPQAESK